MVTRAKLVTYPDKRGIAAISIFFNLTLVISSANPISVGDCGLLVYLEHSGEVFPELVLSFFVLQAIPSK